ncbi:DNA/RNA non-specific endonuclease [Paracoccus shanxieyensis]|uniref:DNA/RNA non-specific endonuclease n=1 Tax=Paracoccus shanxieyensis TaxID=2675752 RepID=A0A6L6IYQ9_9RHOB|nr:DNA/RNA non-specific endonuclease [Paracoccus shanxieyensis]MTH65645.1 DNA/RNA non-specific endonuclease [Paracoccus shanxieyensis]MTH88780.1 DNA/RNA non-specific endonuclease [Paracoccus shanxieyensis]
MRQSFGPAGGLDALRVTEGVWPLGDYADRQGYDPGFILSDTPLPLPGAGRWSDDLVELLPEARGQGDPTELRYTHFSVRMSRSRGLPLYSACNIDGAQSDRDVPRTNTWRRDPRIDPQLQNLREGYGDERRGLFSRGHMTRREDPNWGSRDIAKQADADTFHITNVAPQRQGFNGGIWLQLEDYVLDNTDRANLRVTVMTGPMLSDVDPLYYNRQIPVAFWKVLAFVHPDTRELTTIGYRRAQMDYLPRPSGGRFVFGDFQDSQVPVAGIAEESGLDLAAWAEFDVMAGASAQMELRVSSVSDFYLTR